MGADAPTWLRCEQRRRSSRRRARSRRGWPWRRSAQPQATGQPQGSRPRLPRAMARVLPMVQGQARLARALGTRLNAPQLAAAAVVDVHSVAEVARSVALDARSAAATLAGAMPARWSLTAERSMRGVAEAECPARAWLSRAVGRLFAALHSRRRAAALRDRPGLPRVRCHCRERRKRATGASEEAATRAEAHWLEEEHPTSRSRQSTDG